MFKRGTCVSEVRHSSSPSPLPIPCRFRGSDPLICSTREVARQFIVPIEILMSRICTVLNTCFAAWGIFLSAGCFITTCRPQKRLQIAISWRSLQKCQCEIHNYERNFRENRKLYLSMTLRPRTLRPWILCPLKKSDDASLRTLGPLDDASRTDHPSLKGRNVLGTLYPRDVSSRDAKFREATSWYQFNGKGAIIVIQYCTVFTSVIEM
jgi:hypothetical protein